MNSFSFENVVGKTLLFIDDLHEVTIWADTHISDGDGLMRMFFDNEEVNVRHFSCCDSILEIDELKEEAKNWYTEEIELMEKRLNMLDADVNLT
jgi:hypothetical protein